MLSAVVLKTGKNHYFYDRKSRYLVPVNKLFYDIFYDVTRNELDKIHKMHDNDYTIQELEVCIGKIKNYISLGLVVELAKPILNPLRICTTDVAKLLYQQCSQLLLQVTERCQLDCTYCCYGLMYSKQGGPRDKDMKWGIALHALNDRIKAWSNLDGVSRAKEFYISFYGGEPLLNYELIEKTVLYTNKEMPVDINYRFTMTTNALLLKRHFDFLCEHNFQLLVSLDGDREAHACRLFKDGQSSFDLVIDNLDYVYNNNPEFFRNNIFFNTVVTAKSDLANVIRFINNRYGKFPSFSSLSTNNVLDTAGFQALNVNLQNEMLKTIDITSDDTVRDQLTRLQRTQVQSFIKSYTNYSCGDFITMDSRNNDHCINNGTCLPFFKKIFIDTDGNILPCERVCAPFSLGSIGEQGVLIDFDSLVTKYNLAQHKNAELCEVCYAATFCNHCQYSSFSTGCKYFANKDSFIKRLELMLKQAEIYQPEVAVTEAGING